MSEEKTYQNPLIRDGESQKDRHLKALMPDYVKVDERTRNDLICFAREYAKLIQYYDQNNNRKSAWEVFFNDKTRKDQPHYALFLAFTWLLRYAQKDINSITARHLNYYYREILKLKSKSAVPDTTHILLTLAKNIDQHLVKKGTLLKAGKDALGKELFYAIDEDIVVNKTETTAFKNVFLEPLIQPDGSLKAITGHGIYASPIANSIDGKGADQDVEGLKWKPFGITQYNRQTIQDYTMPMAEIGFAIASPLFHLKEGKRVINIILTHEKNITGDFLPYFFSNILQLDKGDISKGQISPFVAEEVEKLKIALISQLLEEQPEMKTLIKKVRNKIIEVEPGLHDEIITVVDDEPSKEYLETAFLIQYDVENDKITLELIINFLSDVLKTKDFEKDRNALYNLFRDDTDRVLAKFFNAVKENLKEVHEEAIAKTGDEPSKKYMKFCLEDQLGEVLKDAFSVYLTGKEGWIGPVTVSGKLISNRQIEMTIELDHERPAVVGFDKEVLTGNFKTNQPVIKVVLDTSQEKITDQKFLYHTLKDVNLMAFSANVKVSDIRSLVLQNDNANLDPNKPFLPFGPIPALGSSLYIGNEEAFQKKLDQFTLRFHWSEVPEKLNEHYEVYNNELAIDENEQAEAINDENELKEEEVAEEESELLAGPINNQSFKGKLQLLYDREWKDLETTEGDRDDNSFPLFNKTNATEELSVIAQPKTSDSIENYDRASSYGSVNRYDNSTSIGFARLQLLAPQVEEFKAFGHKMYPKLYTNTIIKKVEDDTLPLPNEPYTPLMDRLVLGYESSFSVNLQVKEGIQEQYFHITPFGTYEVDLKEKNKTTVKTFPVFKDEGTLYIGLDKLNAPQNVSLLFEMDEKSVNHEFVGKVEINWSYLSNNKWIGFTEKQILKDTTNLLTKSGIIQFSVPKDITKNNSVLPKELFWLRATVPANTQGIADVVSIKAQAVTATFMDMGNDPGHLATALQPESIKKLKVNDSALKTVEQPYTSFDGKLAERDSDFYTRVSERLRHKKRAITIWDYERLILEEFPDIHKVKCLNHTFFPPGADTDCRTEMTPGAVTLIIIAKVDESSLQENQLTPVANVITINKVKDYLEKIAPPFLTLRQKLVVRNPDYEQVQIKCSVKFRPGYDVGYYKKEVEADITRYLSPWIFDGKKSIGFERKVYKSAVINHIEELPYVNFVCCFETYLNPDEVAGNEAPKDHDIIEASHPAAILVSHTNHIINYIEGDTCDCDAEDNVNEPIPTQGIGVMIIEVDFKVSKPKSDNQNNKP